MTLKHIKAKSFVSLLILLAVGVPIVLAKPSTYQSKPMSLQAIMADRVFTEETRNWYGREVDFIGLAANVSQVSGQIYVFDPETLDSIPGVFVDASDKVSKYELLQVEPGQLIHVKGKVRLDTAACLYIEPDSLEIVEQS